MIDQQTVVDVLLALDAVLQDCEEEVCTMQEKVQSYQVRLDQDPEIEREAWVESFTTWT